jgi:hypothetical protein
VNLPFKSLSARCAARRCCASNCKSTQTQSMPSTVLARLRCTYYCMVTTTNLCTLSSSKCSCWLQRRK